MDRKKVMKTFGGFLSVMLIFTILSRAVSGASMARVETVKIATGTIEHKVAASGKVQAEKEAAVYTEANQRIKEICVKEGESVEEGETVFWIDLEELEEQIMTARQEAEKLKLQDQDVQSAKDFERSSQEAAQRRAQEDYNQAMARGDASIAEAKKDWDDAQQALQEFLDSNADSGGGGADASVAGEDSGGEAPSLGGTLSSADDPSADASSARRNSGQEEIPEGQSMDQAGGPSGQEEGDSAESREQKKASLEQAVAEAKAAYDEAVSARTDNLRTAARAVEDAARPQSAPDTARQQNEIARRQQEQALDKLLRLQEAGGEIKAPVSGAVTQVLFNTGDFTSEGAVMRIADTSGGARIVFSVDKSQEEFVSKGSPVKLKAAGSRESIDGYTVSGVTANEQDHMLLDVAVDLPKGILEAGVLVDAEIVPKPESYSCVVPLEALHEEQNGSYVLILQKEQGVLGTQLAAKRLDVKVADKNDTSAALEEGLLTSDQEIISSSSRMIQEGSRVRRKEDQR